MASAKTPQVLIESINSICKFKYKKDCGNKTRLMKNNKSLIKIYLGVLPIKTSIE